MLVDSDEEDKTSELQRKKTASVSDLSIDSDEEDKPQRRTRMAVIGTVTPFDVASQSWEEYEEMLEMFFEANDIEAAEKKRAVLLSGVGAATYSLLRSLVSPQAPKEKTYDQLTMILKAHYDPTPSESVQRFKFNSRIRKSSESIAEYVAALRKLAQHCVYGDK